MKEFLGLDFRLDQCQRGAAELRQLLQQDVNLGERSIQRFFRARPHLAAFVGSYHPDIVQFDLLAFEYDLFGDFACDLVVGDSRTRAFVFVELEDASKDGVFVRRRNKATPEWSRRFERGFSQIVDWFFKLDSCQNTPDFEARFGSSTISHRGLLIVGRGKPDHMGSTRATADKVATREACLEFPAHHVRHFRPA